MTRGREWARHPPGGFMRIQWKEVADQPSDSAKVWALTAGGYWLASYVVSDIGGRRAFFRAGENDKRSASRVKVPDRVKDPFRWVETQAHRRLATEVEELARVEEILFVQAKLNPGRIPRPRSARGYGRGK